MKDILLKKRKDPQSFTVGNPNKFKIEKIFFLSLRNTNISPAAPPEMFTDNFLSKTLLCGVVHNGTYWYTLVYIGMHWYTLVYNGTH